MQSDSARSLTRVLIFAAVLGALYWLTGALSGVLFPVVFALILAYLLDPLVAALERRGVSRSLAALLLLLFGVGALGALALVLYPVVRGQFQHLNDRLPGLAATLQNEVLPWLQTNLGFETPESISGLVERYSENLKSAAPEILKRIYAWLSGAIGATSAIVSSLLNLVLIPLFAYYFMRDLPQMQRAVFELIPPARRPAILTRLLAIDEVVGHWFRGQLQVAAMLAILYAIGFALVFQIFDMDVMAGVAVGLVGGLLSVIPYVGALTAGVLSVLFALLDWHGLGPLLGVGIVIAIVQIAEGYVLTPRIVGEKLGLGPATVILALLVGGSLGGLVGMLFALPVAGALKVLGADLLDYYRNSAAYQSAPAIEPAPPPARPGAARQVRSSRGPSTRKRRRPDSNRNGN